MQWDRTPACANWRTRRGGTDAAKASAIIVARVKGKGVRRKAK
jgi:hypothetical protein